MPLLKPKELRQKSEEELKNLLKELEDQLLKIETERKLKKILPNPAERKNIKKNIAKIKTILNERKREVL